MRRIATLVAIVAALSARSDDALVVGMHQSYTMRVSGVTAAFAVDSTIADASAESGMVTIYGRGTGRTRVIVVSGAGQTEYEVRVEGAPAPKLASEAHSGANGRIESWIETAVPQVRTMIDVTREEGKRRSEVHVETVSYRASQGERSATTLPSASVRIFTPGREVTFLDRVVDHSPLTLGSATIRGIHYRDERWSALAGYTAYAAYQSFLLPAERSLVAGAAYSMPLSKSSRVTPGVFTFENGTVGSLLYDYERGERGVDGIVAGAELGLSHSLAGAANLAIDRKNDRIRLDLRYRPYDFPGIRFGQPRGFNGDASWSHTFGRGSTADTAVSISDFDFPGLEQRTLTATTNVRYRVSEIASLLGGASYGRFAETRSLTVPAGVQLDFRRLGVSALYRWSESSATNRGGGGFRVAARASAGRLFATTYLDYQKQAPTLSLIFREQPDLALALEQLGITATSPGDIARALRENSALIALGYIDGVTIELTPERTQAGLELAWLGAGAARLQIRGRVLLNRNERVSARTDTIIASLTGSRRLTDSTDVFLGYSYWLTRRTGGEDVAQPSFEVGVRHRFAQPPSLLPDGRGVISGVVFLDENVDGAPDGRVADVEVELDGARKVRTASDGSFSFKGVTRGAHRVVARTPLTPQAFFTTPSRVEAKPGDAIRFGVAITPARLMGRVLTDAGDGLGNVSVLMTRGTVSMNARTGSDGSFSFVAAPGEWQVAIDGGSLPAGYSTTVKASQSVTLDRAHPVSATLGLRANRSVSGRVVPATSSLVLEPGGTRVPVDADGSFALRSLPAGELALRVSGTTQRLTLPNGPARIADIVLGGPATAVASPRGKNRIPRPRSGRTGDPDEK